MTPLDCHSRNPLRPPHWRSARAGALHEGRLRATRHDDAWVRRARGVLAAVARHGGDLGHPGVVAVDPAVTAAYLIHDGGGPLSTEVDARLLCGQDDSIADRVGLDPGVVAAYEALFFDVRAGLEEVDWIEAVVFGTRLHNGSGFGAEDLALKLVAYTFGPIALDAFLGRPVAGMDTTCLVAALRRYARVATARVTTRDAPRWLGVASELAELEREEAASCMAAVSGPIRVRVGAAAMSLAAGAIIDPSAGRSGPDVPPRDDDQPSLTLPVVVVEGLDDRLARRMA